jgi:hypothetical protein
MSTIYKNQCVSKQIVKTNNFSFFSFDLHFIFSRVYFHMAENEMQSRVSEKEMQSCMLSGVFQPRVYNVAEKIK